ncbi:hypothetical protein L1887_38725 [Cichorium endivia]|nr:hypothetical protein L1887_38725 [Cichorium endivia]
MASGMATYDVTHGPVLTLIYKRIRNLSKKLDRIKQMEYSIALCRSNINKEQEKLLKSKPAIIGAVNELEKFRQPLSVAVEKQISLALRRRQATDVAVDDLLSLIYFGSLFDVKSECELESMMLTREIERDCCLAYDRVADEDAADFLEERDLDLIAMMNADVREKLTKIMASDYFKEAPYEEMEDNVTDQQTQTYEDQSAPIENSHKDQQEAENSIEIPVHEEPIEPQTEDNKEQQVHRRPYQN